jgi:hypothetical protein
VFAASVDARAQVVDSFGDPAYDVIRLTPEAGPYFPLPRFIRLSSIAVEVNESVVPRSEYSVDADEWRLYVAPAILDTTHSLRIAFRRIPLVGSASVTLRDTVTAVADDHLQAMPPSIPPTQTPTESVFAAGSLQSRGSISRGVTAGSNRDVGLESGLRVELSGEVSPGVGIRAILNDENTPILPDGTTRRLEEFDRVFIEITSPFGEAQLGDIPFSMQQSEFARLTRNLQGAAVRSRFGQAPGSAVGGEVVATGAISRGQFRSQVIPLIDGVQGPYRLTGSDGERLVLVVPGSERVYWDGLLLERGDQNDYVIDYATGEVRFTSRRLVTDERRALVEFEYSTNQFTRTLVATQAEAHFFNGITGPRVRIGAGVIREADGNQFLDEFGLSREDSLALALAGDGPAVRSGAEAVRFDPEAPYVQYVVRPVEVGDATDSAFVALTFPPREGEPVYRVRFSHVGKGVGSYERGGEAVNGITYRFVGEGGGSYDPVRHLPRPMQQQLVDLHGVAELFPGFEVFGEWAHSYYDQNTLSALDASDDSGNAYLGGARLRPLNLGDLTTISGEIRRRHVGPTFASFDRIRPIEFERHWNLGTGATQAGPFERQETIDEGQVQLRHRGIGEVRIDAGRLTLDQTFVGRRAGVFLSRDISRFPGFEYRAEQIESQDMLALRDGEWFRQRGLIQQSLGQIGVTPFIEFEHEHRRMEVTGTDSLTRDSFRFVRITPGIRWVREEIGSGDVSLSYRRNAEWHAGLLYPSSRSVTASASGTFAPSTTISGEARVGYRHRSYTDTFRALGNADQSSLLLQLHARWRPHPQAVEILASYDASGERTPLLQEVFVRVGPEFGTYVWEDFNNDGIIQPDEMIPERTPNEGVFARTFIPSDDLIATNTVNARLQMRLDPSTVWRNADGWRGVLSHASGRTVLEVLETTRDPDLLRIYSLHLTRYRDPVNTINGRLRVGQDISLFPRSRLGGIDIGFNQTATLNTRTGGQDERLIRMWRAEGRLRPLPRLSVRNEIAWERNRHESEAFATRRYDIRALRLEPEVSAGLTRSLQLTARAPLAWKQDDFGNRRATLVRAPMELRYQRAARASLTARAEVAHVMLTGAAVGLAEFELTDGRGPGTSYLWGLSGQYQLNEYLRATLQYDGRLPDGLDAIHTMRMQLSAIF